ncbi:MAG: sel1 repeat family protein [Proteobacteria bacterium]|nr:sel1 repeat family protein [Pseudomonadota bacterium]MBU1649479.1 sel1 repeat family protein [Pseudomonadota bacterium]MBU1986888.1 sel1 repeat family protein [Pseudomonadota bacterium]
MKTLLGGCKGSGGYIMGRLLLCLMVVLIALPGFCLADDDSYSRQIQDLAGQGDGESQFALALLYEYGGQGVAPDPQKAVTWLVQAGEAGIPAACLYLGIKYENGSGVTRNLATAGNWYCCAAQKGWAMAQFFLAELYEKGKEVKKDNSLALVWYGLAEEQGYPGAKEAMALLTREMSEADRKKVDSLRVGLRNSKVDCSRL